VYHALVHSLVHKTKLSIEASTAKRDSFPSVQISIVDPNGRFLGLEKAKPKIPKSLYSRTDLRGDYLSGRPIRGLRLVPTEIHPDGGTAVAEQHFRILNPLSAERLWSVTLIQR
jgi:hypothetical protein